MKLTLLRNYSQRLTSSSIPGKKWFIRELGVWIINLKSYHAFNRKISTLANYFFSKKKLFLPIKLIGSILQPWRKSVAWKIWCHQLYLSRDDLTNGGNGVQFCHVGNIQKVKITFANMSFVLQSQKKVLSKPCWMIKWTHIFSR